MQQQAPDDLVDRLATLLERAVNRRRHVRHGLLGVARTDGLWQWSHAVGIADGAGTTVTTSERYPIASVTKLFTAAVTFRLIEQGALALEDRLVDLLPQEMTHGLHVLDGFDHTGTITVEHLLGHTSGLADYYEEAPPGGRSAQARLLAGEDAPVSFEEVLSLVRNELTPHFAPQPLDTPKPQARYADTNYQLIGAIIEELTGEPLSGVFDQMVFAPLGLDDTSSYPHPPRSGRSPEPTTRVWAKDIMLNPGGALRHQVADGGIISTVGDQMRFMRAIVTGEVFSSDESWPRMQRRFARVFFPVDYGLGVMRYAPPRWMSPAFAVPPIIGHTGSTATWLFHCPRLGIVTAGTFDVTAPPLPFRFLPSVLRAIALSN
jgi:D-alanyl-D-alanine carboxypeptidase